MIKLSIVGFEPLFLGSFVVRVVVEVLGVRVVHFKTSHDECGVRIFRALHLSR